mgnify:FL=1
MSAEFEAWKSAVSSVLVWPQRTTVYTDASGTFFRGNYVVFFPSMPDVESERFNAPASAVSRRDVEVGWKLVATTAEALVGAIGLLSGLIGRELMVAGRSCSPLEVESSGPVSFDKEAGGLFFIDGFARFTSRPA